MDTIILQLQAYYLMQVGESADKVLQQLADARKETQL
jgi:hypothetical protein